MNKEYVRFDEREDVLASLALLELVAPQIKERPLYWKWMIIGAEDVLQGAMVCALRTSALNEKSASQMKGWLNVRTDNPRNLPDVRLADFGLLLDKCSSDLGLVLSDDQRRDLDRVHKDFRNEFVHFKPELGWSIHKADFRRVVETALDAVSYLMSLDRVSAMLYGEQQQRLEASVAHIKRALKVEKESRKA